jgi:hypothetical protein
MSGHIRFAVERYPEIRLIALSYPLYFCFCFVRLEIFIFYTYIPFGRSSATPALDL